MAKYIELEQLAARIDQSRKDRMELHDIECPSLGGTIRVKKMRLNDMLALLDSVGENIGAQEAYEYNKEIVYKHCPVMQRKELQEGEDIIEPYDVVDLIFNDNAQGINDLAEQILDLYGLGDDLANDIKNS